MLNKSYKTLSLSKPVQLVKFWSALVCFCVLAFLPSQSQAQLMDPTIGIGLKGGSTGLGVDLTKGLWGDLNLRVGYNNALSLYSFSFNDSGIRYDADWELESVPLLLDWHVFSGAFRLTGGLYYNNNKFALTATPTGNTVVGSNTFTPAQLGRLKGTVKLGNKWVPYFGLGFGNAIGEDKWFGVLGLQLDIGAYYQGAPSVTLRQDGGAATVSQADLDAESAQIEDSISSLKIYPVVTLGLTLKF